MNYKNKHFKIFEKEYEDQFDDYRKEKVDEKEKYINEKKKPTSNTSVIKTITIK